METNYSLKKKCFISLPFLLMALLLFISVMPNLSHSGKVSGMHLAYSTDEFLRGLVLILSGISIILVFMNKHKAKSIFVVLTAIVAIPLMGWHVGEVISTMLALKGSGYLYMIESNGITYLLVTNALTILVILSIGFYGVRLAKGTFYLSKVTFSYH